ncbi:MAG: class I SAM-dependent methyltransferase [Ferruginibacter sp.]|nr:class I SAM-dependent methyltransferase [Chitinophagaceae bacterium]
MIRNFIKRLYFAFRPSHRMVILDYPVEPKAVYSPEHPHKGLFEIISGNEEFYRKLLLFSLQFKEQFFTIKENKIETDLTRPGWNNDYLPGLDIIILYTLLNYHKPKSYIEIGNGTSTKTALKARKENNLDFLITCIDPHPRQEIELIADKWYHSVVQDVPVEVFRGLSENDIVFLDGTHMLYPNSDVMWFFLEVLPVLPKGVIVQVHDIYIPYDYPRFMCERYYSENYLLGALLLNNPSKYEVLAPNFYISEQKHLSGILTELWQHPNLQKTEQHGGSFWFRIK